MPFSERIKEHIARLITKADLQTKNEYDEILEVDFLQENLAFMKENPEKFKDYFRKIMLKMPFDVEELARFQATLLGEITAINLPDEQKFIKEMSSENSNDSREIIDKLIDGFILSVGKIGGAVGK